MATALAIVKTYFPKVTKVNDATKSVDIEVTKADSTSAQVRNHNACAMAVACKRKMKLDGVIVSVNTVYAIKGDTATRYKVPQSVSREIVSFDRKAGFSEGTYQLVPVPPSNRLGMKHYPKETPSDETTRGNLKKRFHHLTTGVRAALGSKVDVRY